MTKNTLVKWMLATSLMAMAAGCGNGEAPGMQQQLRTEMNEERQEEAIEQREEVLDEREDENLRSPAVEYRQEQREDRLDEMEDNM